MIISGYQYNDKLSRPTAALQQLQTTFQYNQRSEFQFHRMFKNKESVNKLKPLECQMKTIVVTDKWPPLKQSTTIQKPTLNTIQCISSSYSFFFFY